MPLNSTSATASWPDFTNSRYSASPNDYSTRTAHAFNSRPLSSTATAVQVEGELFKPAETVAQVGDQYILKGELLGDANLILSMPFAQLGKLPPEEREQTRQALLEYREQLMEKQLLGQAIERKLKYLEFLRSIPTESDPKKAEDRRHRMQIQAGKAFAENLNDMLEKLIEAKPEEYQEISRQSPQLYRIALVMKEANIKSLDDPALEKVLRAHETSLAKQQQAFMEYAIGQTALRQNVNFQPEITHAQMVAYYREHEADYHIPTRAQWEQLTVLFQRIPDQLAAENAICGMGNEVYLGGAPLWAVAQRKSHEKNASHGGFHDWTTFGDLKISKPINDTVFSIELNTLSDIIRDDKGFHIVRVLNRQNTHVQPFTEVQADIKETLRTEMLNKAYSEYVAKLRERTPVITEFDNAVRLATPNSQPNGVSR